VLTPPHVGRDEVEHFRGQAAGQAHALDVFRGLDDDGHGGGPNLNLSAAYEGGYNIGLSGRLKINHLE
jgi:hypothetical protein